MPRVVAYQHGIFPRSEAVVAATRGLERGRNTADDVARAVERDQSAFIEAQRRAGLDYFSDGLLRWQDIFRPLVRLSGGLAARTLVRWFDNNSFFRAPEVMGDLTLTAAIPEEMHPAAVPEPRVATLPSPYLFSRAAQSSDDRNPLMTELTREVLRPVAQALVDHGYALIHLEEPWLAYHGIEREDWDEFEKAVLEVREATRGATLVLHTYFGDAGPLADRLRTLPVDAVGVDLTETDPASLGSAWTVGLLAGVLDGRRSFAEPEEGVVDLVRRTFESVQPPALYVSSNSELEMLPTELAERKVMLLGRAAARLKEVLA